MERVLIVGASHAGTQLAASLRQEGWTGDIVLIDDEPALPYHRPPLSKAYLAGKVTLEDIAIRGADFYTTQKIQRRVERVASIDRSTGSLVLSSGERLRYDWLALCTGARPRLLRLPGAEASGVHYLRSAHDVERIRQDALRGQRAVLIGGGYIGLETAASLRTQGLDVTVLEANARVLERVTAPQVSDFFTRIHGEEGVDIRTGAAVESLRGSGEVRDVQLVGGETFPADLVIVGVGVEPNTEIAVTAGLLVDNGIVIDENALTDDPRIVAAGDCTSHWVPRYGRQVRLESVPSAGEQAKVAAATITGKSRRISALPWFWSDQYDVKLQIAGLHTGYDEVVISGKPDQDRDFTCFYLLEGELIAADCVNRPRDFMYSKRAIDERIPVDRGSLERGIAPQTAPV